MSVKVRACDPEHDVWRWYNCEVVFVAEQKGVDLALLKINALNTRFKPINIRNCKVDTGDRVVAIGYPLFDPDGKFFLPISMMLLYS